MSTSLQCPKCGAPMRTYERNGINVDQCTGCRGIFLDAGELEHLVGAEQRWYVPEPSPQQVQAGRDDHHRDEYRPDRYRGHKKSKKKSFLSEMFELGD
jgi:uncharacterized protein